MVKNQWAAKLSLIVMSVLLVAVLFGSGYANAAKTTVTFWYSWAGDEAKVLEDLIAKFNKSSKNVMVKGVSNGSWENHHPKLLTAISGGTAPDCANIGSDYIQEWAHNGALIPLDNMIKKDKVDLKDFYPVCLEMGKYNGKLYGLTLNNDTYALIWNKELFKKAGLDPNKPPKTIEELDAMAEKLTIKDDKGGYKQMGFMPDYPWGHMDVYIPAFGGKPYNPKTKKITANDPNIIRMFEWELSYYKKYNAKSLSAFKSGLGQYATGSYPFYTGQVAMVVEGEWQANFIPLYAPKGFSWGAAPFPSPKNKPGAYGSCYAIGSVLVIPKGAKHSKEAWQFIKWMEKPANGGKFSAGIANNPPFKSLAKNPEFFKDSRSIVFLKLLEKASVWPKINIGSMYMSELGSAEEAILIAGTKTPKQAMDELTKKMQKELDKSNK